MRVRAVPATRCLLPFLIPAVVSVAATAHADRVVVFPVAARKLPRAYKTAPTVFTEFLAQAVRDGGREVTVADASLGETTTMLGCDPAATACLEMVATTLNADELVFSTVRRGRKSAELRVALSRFKPGEERQDRSISLSEQNLMGLAQELATAARLFLGGATVTSEPKPKPDPVSPPASDPISPPVDPGLEVGDTTEVDQGFSMGRVEGYTWAIVGVGALAAGTGGTFLAMAAGVSNDVEKAPTDTVADFKVLADLEKKGKTFSDVGTGPLAVGGAALTAGIILMVLQGGSAEGTVGAEETPAVSVVPWLGPDGVGVTVGLELF